VAGEQFFRKGPESWWAAAECKPAVPLAAMKANIIPRYINRAQPADGQKGIPSFTCTSPI